jgi:uncharacterized protein YtpQ (UPF0354 family)
MASSEFLEFVRHLVRPTRSFNITKQRKNFVKDTSTSTYRIFQHLKCGIMYSIFMEKMFNSTSRLNTSSDRNCIISNSTPLWRVNKTSSLPRKKFII